jgi:hypothetical protein
MNLQKEFAPYEDEDDSYVPNPIEEINELISGTVEIDDQLINKAEKAMGLDKESPYEISKADDIIEFLESHKGNQAFTVSW